MIVNKGRDVAKGTTSSTAISDHFDCRPHNRMFHVEKTGTKGFPSGDSGA
jgi:hypothetical protein